MIEMHEGELRPMNVNDLEQVLAWRNHPSINRYMLTQHEISEEEHRQWFVRASEAPDKHLLIFEMAGVPLGFVHFTGGVSTSSADWGFYTAVDAPKGSGRKLGKLALDYAFGQAGFHKVCGQALDNNQASIRLHLALGFKQEGVLRQQHYIGGIYHDMICFGLLRNEWPEGARGAT